MLKRLAAPLLVAFALTMLLFVAGMVFFSSHTQAAAPLAEAKSGQSAASVAAPKVAGPSVANWVDIAPFPTVTVSPTPGTTSLRLKRAGAAAYPPNGKVYVLGGRHGTDGEDISSRWIWEYTPGSPGSWAVKNSLLDGSQPGSRWTANMAVALLTDASGPRIYAIGGSSINSDITSTVRIYDPVADSLSILSTDPWPASPMRIPGGYAVYNNQLYIFGGFSAFGTGGVFTDTWKFNPDGSGRVEMVSSDNR